MKHRVEWLAAGGLGVVVGPALAGPDWDEIGDAGSLAMIGSAQIVSGQGQISRIRGRLEVLALAGTGDLEDVFFIHIDTPNDFCFVLTTNAGAAVNAHLWLFNSDGTGLLGNLQAPMAASCPDATAALPPSPYLVFSSNDGSGAMITAAGDYYLAISAAGRVPVSSSGDIFFFSSSTEISGPDGAGGGGPMIGWAGVPAPTSNYDGAVQATAFPDPPPGYGACCLPNGGGCIVTTEINCSGEYQGDGIACHVGLCPDLRGACCVGSSCSVTTQQDCSGLFQGVGSRCAPDPCGSGACCTGSICGTASQAACQAGGGLFLGNGTSCLPNPCQPPTGACCVGNACSITTAAGCSGSYQGDGTSCSPNPCQPPPPSGACCLPNGSCTVTTNSNCSFMNGAYQGNGSACSPNPCPPPNGACCLDNGSCMFTSQGNCFVMGGTYQGNEVACVPNPCAAPIPVLGPLGLSVIASVVVAVGIIIIVIRRAAFAD